MQHLYVPEHEAVMSMACLDLSTGVVMQVAVLIVQFLAMRFKLAYTLGRHARSERRGRAHEALGALAAVAGDSNDLHAQLVQLVVDLLQAGQVVLADGAVLAAVHHYQLPLARRRAQLDPAPLQQHVLDRQKATPSLSASLFQ